MTDKKINNTVNLSNSELKLSLTVCSDIEKGENSNSLLVKCNDSRKLHSGQKFNLYFDKGNSIKCGDIITAKVLLFETDYSSCKQSLKYSNTYGNLWLKDFENDDSYNMFYRFCGNTRKFVKETLKSNVSNDAYATITAIMLGDKSSLSDGFCLNIKRSGTSHIMVVSGLHLSIILGVILFITDRIIKNKFLRFIITFLLIVLICGISGFMPSIIRAGIMYLFYSFGVLLNRDNDNLNTIGFTVVFMLLFSPLLLFNLSFELSLIAVFSVLCVSPYFYLTIINKLKIESTILVSAVQIMVVSVIAQIFTSPIIIFSFGTLSLIAPVTNLFISLAVTYIFIFALLGLCFFFVPTVCTIIFFVCDFLAKYINLCINSFGSFVFSAVDINNNLFFIPIFIIVLILLFTKKSKEGNSCLF